MKRSTAPINWKRNLILIWISELVALSGFSVVMPFLPYYVQELGITDLKQVAFWSGILTSTQMVSMSLMAPVWGALSDRYGRKVMVVRAMLGGAVIIGLMGFVGNVYQLAVLRFIQGSLTGTVSAATTLVVSSTPPERRGYALGMLQMAVFLGGSIGPLLGGFIADSLGYRPTFWITGSLLLASGIFVSLMVREEFTPPMAVEGGKASLIDGLLVVLRTQPLMVVFGVRVLMRLAANVVNPIMPLFVQGIAAPDAKIASVTGTISGIASGASAIGAVLMGRLADRIGPRRILLTCATLSCLLYAVQPLAQTPFQFLLLRTASGIAMGGIVASISALQAALAPKNLYGAVYGVDTSLVAAANAAAPMIGATLTASFGLSSAFLGAALLYGLGTLVAAIVVPGRRPAPAPSSAES